MLKILKKMNDEHAIDYITQLKGLGVWSAQMFLMFNLNRPDIFPTQDIGLIRAISKNYKTSYPPGDRFLNKISKYIKVIEAFLLGICGEVLIQLM